MDGVVVPGRLLVAAPSLHDPNFRRAVVLVLDHSEDGTVGIVLNRKTRSRVGDALPEWGRLASAPGLVHLGGPVSTDAVIGLAVFRGDAADDGLTAVHDRIGVLDLSCPPARFDGVVEGVRLLAGYAGWAPGQLDDELDEGAWYVVDCEITDALDDDPDTLWARVLRRQRGPLRLVATFPDDPRTN